MAVLNKVSKYSEFLGRNVPTLLQEAFRQLLVHERSAVPLEPEISELEHAFAGEMENSSEIHSQIAETVKPEEEHETIPSSPVLTPIGLEVLSPMMQAALVAEQNSEDSVIPTLVIELDQSSDQVVN